MNIVWLEDNKSTATRYRQILINNGLKFTMLGSMQEVVALINDDVDPKDILFIIDIMLHGVDDLNGIEIANAPTRKGSRAGQVFVERYLRAPTSKFIGCPVIFLTERVLDATLEGEIETLRRSPGGEVCLFGKFSDDHANEFIRKIKSLSAPPAEVGSK